MSKFSLSSNDIKLLKRAIRYILPYKLKFVVSFICILSGIGFGLVQPLIWGKFITCLFEKKFELAIINMLYISVLFLVETLVRFMQNYFLSFLNESVISDIKKDMYEKIIDMPVKAFDEMRTGDFLSRLYGDASSIANVVTNQLINALVDILKVIIIGVTAFSISPPLALIIILTFPVSYYIFTKYGGIIRKKNEELSKINDSFFSKTGESIFGIREVKCLGVKRQILLTYDKLLSLIKGKAIDISVKNNVSQSLSQTANFFSQVAVMSVGAYFIYINFLTMQYFIAFNSYSNQFSNSLMNLTRLNSDIQQILTSLERIFSVMDNLSYEKEIYGKKNIQNVSGGISFKNIYFEYKENQSILKGVSFDIKPNSKTAIVGVSGGGKTTIFNLLLRLYSPKSGEIKIDGTDIRDFDEESLRKHISIVRQDPFLFEGTIKENFLIVNPEVTSVEIEKACKRAEIHNFIDSLPNKYDTRIGENAVTLSGGQKQRIAIARALIKNSKIILFDEATSSLDNESQYCIKKSIDMLCKNHTIIIIAHRLLTVIEADEIIVMDKGNVSAQGKHNMLIEENEVYRKLYEMEVKTIRKKEKEVV